MNLKEALKRGKLKQFAKEHENKDPHPMGKERFDWLMDAMTKGRPPIQQPATDQKRRRRTEHASDCAVHDAPAYKAGACTCGADPKARR